MFTVAPRGIEKAHILEGTPSFRQESMLKGMDALEDARLKLVSIVGACLLISTRGFSLPIRSTNRQYTPSMTANARTKVPAKLMIESSISEAGAIRYHTDDF